MFLIVQHWGCDSRLNWLLKPSDVITAGLNLLKYIYWLNTLMCATCWQRLWWMCVFDVHSAVLTFPRSTPWSRRLALENNIQTFAWLAGWSVPSSHHCPQARLTSSCHRHSAHRGMCPYALHGLGRLTQRHRSLTSNLLPNWVIPLTAASKLHFCWFFFLPSPPTSAALVPERVSADCLAAPLIERGRCISEAAGGSTLHTKCARSTIRRDTDRRGISEWEGGKSRTTRHYRDQTLSDAAAQASSLQQLRSSAVNLVILMQMVLVVIVGLELIFNVAYILKIDWMCISITQETEDVPVTPLWRQRALTIDAVSTKRFPSASYRGKVLCLSLCRMGPYFGENSSEQRDKNVLIPFDSTLDTRDTHLSRRKRERESRKLSYNCWSRRKYVIRKTTHPTVAWGTCVFSFNTHWNP